jgi:hypothetical protein
MSFIPMSFYALLIVCSKCGTVSLIGGGARNDVAPWRKLTVECRQCSAQVHAIHGVAIDLKTVGRDLASDGVPRDAIGCMRNAALGGPEAGERRHSRPSSR